MTILGLRFENIPELSNSDSTCQKEVMGSNLSLRHKVFLWLIKGHKVPEGTGRAPTTSLQEACTLAVNVDLVTEARWGQHTGTQGGFLQTPDLLPRMWFSAPNSSLETAYLKGELQSIGGIWLDDQIGKLKYCFQKKSPRTHMGLPNLRKKVPGFSPNP